MISLRTSMTLYRYESTERATWGRLYLPDGETLEVLECPWRDNEPFVSCVPAGEYLLVQHSTERYPQTWALVGGTVGQSPSEGRQRWACVFHAGNVVTDTQGCLLLGTRREGDRLVESAAAVEKFRLALAGVEGQIVLEIRDGVAAERSAGDVTFTIRNATAPVRVAETEADMGGFINLGAIFGDKPWFHSMTAWGLVIFVAGESTLDEACSVGLIGAAACATAKGIVAKAGVVLTALGIRRAAVANRSTA